MLSPITDLKKWCKNQKLDFEIDCGGCGKTMQASKALAGKQGRGVEYSCGHCDNKGFSFKPHPNSQMANRLKQVKDLITEGENG